MKLRKKLSRDVLYTHTHVDWVDAAAEDRTFSSPGGFRGKEWNGMEWNAMRSKAWAWDCVSGTRMYVD